MPENPGISITGCSFETPEYPPDTRVIDLTSTDLDLPVIEAVRRGSQLVFWCAFCRHAHWHGAHSSLCACDCPMHDRPDGTECTCPIGTGDGHRTAHCYSKTSPLHATGYRLTEVPR